MTSYPSEPLDLQKSLYGRVQTPLIRAHLRFQNKVNPRSLLGALTRLFEDFPLVLGELNPTTRRWIIRKEKAEMMLRRQPFSVESDRDSLLYQLQGEDPSLVVFLLEGTGFDVMNVVVSHLICDGAGFRELLYRLSEIYSAIEKGKEPSHENEWMRRRSLSPLFSSLSTIDKQAILSHVEPYGTRDCLASLPLGSQKGEGSLAVTAVPAGSFQRITTSLHSQDLTWNDLLMAAYVRTLFEVFSFREITLNCPVDLRRYLPHGTKVGICNFNSSYFVHVDSRFFENLPMTVAEVHRQISRQKAERFCFKNPLDFSERCKTMTSYTDLGEWFYSSYAVPSISFTNLGVLDSAKLSFDGSSLGEAYFATAIKVPPNSQVCVSSFQNACTLTSCLYADESQMAMIKKLLEGIVARIESF